MNIVLGAACAEEGAGAVVAERGHGATNGAADGAARASPRAPGGRSVGAPEGLAGAREAAPPGQCCYVRCGAQLRYHKIPWEVQGSCDAEGWQFCEQFYVAKLVDAAWLRC